MSSPWPQILHPLVDPVKAFDSIQHDVLFEILKKYGLPISLIDVIRKLYKNCHIQLKLRTTLENVPYETGVQQGNNMAPILFLFMMQVVMQTLKKALPQKLDFRFFPNDKGHLLGQRMQSA